MRHETWEHLLTPNLFIIGIVICCLFVFIWSIYLLIKDFIPPKPPSDKLDGDARICGFKYSLKEDIDKRREEISKHKF